MRQKSIQNATDLVGFHSPELYEAYRDDVRILFNESIKFGLEWSICKIFILGTMIGVNEERKKHKERSEIS